MRHFIEASALLFIASRNHEGALDVSPRGGQPSVAKMVGDAILLPDYMGNKRLDTIGNILASPEIGMLFVCRAQSRILKLRGRAEVSFAPEHMGAFPADELPLMSVLVITPTVAEFATSTAFDRAGFWLDPSRRKPPMDLLGILRNDFELQRNAGNSPVLKNATELDLLERHGIRAAYGASSQLVNTKVYATAETGTQAFIDEAGFLVTARADADGGITMDLSGEAPLQRDHGANTTVFRLSLPPEATAVTPPVEPAEIAILGSSPGRAEIVRMNGSYSPRQKATGEGQELLVSPREIFFHCPLALTRSRVWMADRPQPWTGRRKFTCVEARRESPEVMSFVFQPTDRASVPDIPAGQYVTVSVPHDPVDPPRRRSYSVSAQPGARQVQISVRRIGAGGLSDLLHDSVVAGSEVLLGVPAGRFLCESPEDRPVVLVSAGVGITPVLPMLRRLAATEGAPVWFVHGARDGAHHLFPDEVREIARTALRPIHPVAVYSRPAEGDAPDLTGRIDAARLAALSPVSETDYYICGPDDFMTGLKTGLVALGAVPDRVQYERFNGQNGPMEGMASLSAARAPCAVTFRKSGRTVEWRPESGTLLDLAIEHKVNVAYSCRMGDCQSCVQRLVSGAADHLCEEEPLLGEGQILLCQAVPGGDVVIDC